MDDAPTDSQLWYGNELLDTGSKRNGIGVGAVLVCVPLRPQAPRVDLSTMLALDALEYDGVLDVMLMRSAGGLTHADDLAAKLTEARRVALDGQYSALLIVEADMLPPPHTVQALMAGDCDIAYGTYCSRRNGHSWLVTQSAERLGHLEYPDSGTLRRGGWIDSQGIGTGCTLIRRKALGLLSFRGGEWTPDWHLAQDAVRLGLRQMHNLSVRCGHRISEREIVWPDPAAAQLYRIDAHPHAWRLDGQYRVADGQHIGFSNGGVAAGGDVVRLPDDVAVRMFRSGTIEEM